MATDQSGTPGLDGHPFTNAAVITAEDTEEGYVRIEQSLGNQLRYTPAEAEAIAQEILETARDADERR
ncbi:hypothetical protein ACFQGE_05515 [Halomicroarcula sp. GCM10025817]|uniref:hypothetical protein n=1 Tax=Haloarcula TaxID=2237 RepID=UPI0023E8F174|nr:hypothetical protein [Halomicroarcula sp. SYNS111]